MPIRLSGLISGMDTDALVQELVSAYSTKKDNYVKKQTKLEWQMDAWKSLNTKVYSFYTGKLSGMRFSTNYNKKTVKVSDDTKATVSASSSAVNGDQTLEIKSLAKTGYLTGAEIKDASGNHYKQSTKLSEIDSNFTSGAFNVNVGGKTTKVELTGDTTLGAVVAKLKDAGLTASYDEANGRFFVSSPKSGASNDFSLTGADASGVSTLKALGLFSDPTASELAEYQKIANWKDADIKKMAANDYLKTQIASANATYTDNNATLVNDNKELQKRHTYAAASTENKQKSYKAAKDGLEAANKEYDAIKTDYEALKQKAEGDLTEEEKTNLEKYKKLEENVKTYEETLDMYDEINNELGITATANAKTEDDKTTYEVTITDPADATKESVVKKYQDKIEANNKKIEENNEAVKANNALLETQYETADITTVEFTAFGEATKRNINYGVTDYTKEIGYTKKVEYYEKAKEEAQKVIDDAGIQTAATDKNKAVRVEGADATIVLNGAEFTSNTNNFSINGLTITATALTETGKPITVTTAADVDGVYNMVKEFITEYNTLIKEMDTLYNAASAKGYEPLTDEEKEAMSDTEVEKWEKKIKDSLLRRDSTLQSVTSSMKTMMSKAYNVNGQSYTLSSFGIKTLGYFSSGENEKGVYHIDGDSKDDQVSGNEDKLRAAIANDPDTVISFLSQMSKGVYDTLTKKMSASSVSSAYTLYNDKEMKKRYEEYDDTIEKWEEKVADIEDKYYKQFSAMESALAKLQSSTSALSSLMGTSQ